MLSHILSLYRKLPLFKGKFTAGRLLFKPLLNKEQPVTFIAKQNIKYTIPNTIENLGLELLINGIYEADIISVLQRAMKNDNVFFDVGANIGSIGLPVVKSQKGIRYFGFEASPKTFEYLLYNFQHNSITDYELHNKLIHEDNNKKMKFYEAIEYGKSSLAPSYSADYVYVDSVSLDNFCIDKSISTIDLMKVDVQGFELFVFKGLQKMLLQKKVKKILFEFEDWAEDAAGINIGEAQKFLLECGYHLYTVDGKKLNSICTKGSCMMWAKPY